MAAGDKPDMRRGPAGWACTFRFTLDEAPDLHDVVAIVECQEERTLVAAMAYDHRHSSLTPDDDRHMLPGRPLFAVEDTVSTPHVLHASHALAVIEHRSCEASRPALAVYHIIQAEGQEETVPQTPRGER